jgi:hypothetical protein
MPRYYLLSLNKISFRLILIEGVTLIIYLIYNLGTRIIGLFYIIKQFIQKKITVLELSLIITIIASIILTTSLVQKGGDWWNTVQFFGYGLLLANFFAASFLYKLSFYNKKIFILFVSLIVLLTMPLNIELIIKALQKPNQNNISIDEIKALRFLKTQNNNGAIFALPIFSQLAYLPAFSTKPVFYADEGLLSNLGVNYEKRKKILQDLKNINFNNLSIRYFYLLKEDKNYEIIIKKIYQLKKIKIIYNNPKVIIYEKL